jgi:hypothetical protein
MFKCEHHYKTKLTLKIYTLIELFRIDFFNLMNLVHQLYKQLYLKEKNLIISIFGKQIGLFACIIDYFLLNQARRKIKLIE